MKILFYGAGVTGSYLIHVLLGEGHEVNVVLREEKKKLFAENGMEIIHKYQHLKTVDRPGIAEGEYLGEQYDAVFAAMPFTGITEVLKELAAADAPAVILVGNNPIASEMEKYIKKYSAKPKEVLFGFQATAGKTEDGKIICARLGAGYMDIGCTNRLPSDEIKKRVSEMFSRTGYKLNWRADMKEYLICHPAAILPIAYTVYACGGELKNADRKQRKMMFEASAEAYDLLKRTGVIIRPENDDKYFGKGIRGLSMKLIYFIMAKTSVGEYAFSAHCRNAVAEMEKFDAFYENMREPRPDIIMNTWDELKSKMPSWEELKETYGN